LFVAIINKLKNNLGVLSPSWRIPLHLCVLSFDSAQDDKKASPTTGGDPFSIVNPKNQFQDSKFLIS